MSTYEEPVHCLAAQDAEKSVDSLRLKKLKTWDKLNKSGSAISQNEELLRKSTVTGREMEVGGGGRGSGAMATWGCV